MTAGAAVSSGRYVLLRSLAMGLFALAVLNFGWHAVLVATEGMRWTKLLPCLLGAGLALGSFGANDDTALFLGRDAPPGSAGHQDFEQERARRPARVAQLHASPRAALVLPAVALLLLCWNLYRAATWQAPLGPGP